MLISRDQPVLNNCYYKDIMPTYKHSGAAGDLAYGLALAKHFGPGDFLVHLNQMNWVGQHYYGALPEPFHRDRLNQSDFEWMRSLIGSQPYIKDCRILDPKTAEVTHNLDRFREVFVGHPGNYVDCYSAAFRIDDPELRRKIRQTPWIIADPLVRNDGRDIAVNRTTRWLPPQLPEQWATWQPELEQRTFFVGLESEHVEFKRAVGWDIPYQPVGSMLELAQYIRGASRFIGNQSQALALAIGMGQDYWCELRRDLPRDRNECHFLDQPGSNYF